MQPAIRVENLSKQYRIGARQDGYMTLRESLTHAAAAPWRRVRRFWPRPGVNGIETSPGSTELAASQPLVPSPQASNTIWALKDVSFDVQPGEVVGIIGRNGAGKSTLLKILSRITEPTSGRVALHGRVASLLEVGTGFHPELTGRENIYLNGAILGMTRREIARKFDEIVDFSEIERFLDTPVKRYSSGMYVRLAFAVAAHLEPEILVVDEVLAVGDQSFQKKCLGKMNEVHRSGRTVLFVSHNMGAILDLCGTAALLEAGELLAFDTCERVVDTYGRSSTSYDGSYLDLRYHPGRRRDRTALLTGLRLLDSHGLPTSQFLCGDSITIELLIEPHPVHNELNIRIRFDDAVGVSLFSVATHLSPTGPIDIRSRRRIHCCLPELPLAPGQYSLTLFAGSTKDLIDVVDQATSFEVVAADFYGTGRLPTTKREKVLMRSRWTAVAN
jgi:lipopolysaccharide transport system ATP-binding protein